MCHFIAESQILETHPFQTKKSLTTQLLWPSVLQRWTTGLTNEAILHSSWAPFQFACPTHPIKPLHQLETDNAAFQEAKPSLALSKNLMRKSVASPEEEYCIHACCYNLVTPVNRDSKTQAILCLLPSYAKQQSMPTGIVLESRKKTKLSK